MKIEVLSILSEHKRAANCVKFCPVLVQNQPLLASSDDDGVVCLWTRCDDKEKYAASFLDDDTDLNKEYWKVSRTLRGHIEEVQDLCWNSDGTLLLSGSIDTSARLWHVATGQCLHAFRESKGLVQGVAIDPLGKFIATFADDKSVRIYHATNKRCAYRNTKFVHNDKAMKLFGDTGDGFFHRICFSPHGEFFVVPSGSYAISAESSIFCTYVYSRDNLSKPVLYLPCGKRPSVSISFCPIKFKYRVEQNDGNEPQRLFNLSYRLVFVVITESSLLFYDTEKFEVFSKVENIHYASLNSGTWNKDGSMFVATSSDGYATICTFDDGELGERVAQSEIVFQTVQTPHSTPVAAAKDSESVVDETNSCSVTPVSATLSKSIESSEKATPQKQNSSIVESNKATPNQEKLSLSSTPGAKAQEKSKVSDMDRTPSNGDKVESQPSTPVSGNKAKGKLAPLALKTILKPMSPAEPKVKSPAVSPKSVTFSPQLKQKLVPGKGKVDSHAKKSLVQKSKTVNANSNQITSAFARGSRILAESLKNQKPEDICVVTDSANPICIDDDSVEEVVSKPLSDKSSDINLTSPAPKVGSAPTTPKSILKTPSPNSPAPQDSGNKRRVSFKTVVASETKLSKLEEIDNRQEASDNCGSENLQGNKSGDDDSKSAESEVAPTAGKKRKIAFTTIA